MENEKIVAVSGGFDPIHIGHIRLFKEAKKLGNKKQPSQQPIQQEKI
jgi:glycerol-3-phosphate cytidylyltransferase-like family protein